MNLLYVVLKNKLWGLNGVDNVSAMSQSVQNIIADDHQQILDLKKWH